MPPSLPGLLGRVSIVCVCLYWFAPSECRVAARRMLPAGHTMQRRALLTRRQRPARSTATATLLAGRRGGAAAAAALPAAVLFDVLEHLQLHLQLL